MFEDYLPEYNCDCENCFESRMKRIAHILSRELVKEFHMVHKKIMEKASKALSKDAKHYKAEAKHAKGAKKKHEMIEEREASSAAKDLKKRAKKAHEY